jgi:hypothetical protein
MNKLIRSIAFITIITNFFCFADTQHSTRGDTRANGMLNKFISDAKLKNTVNRMDVKTINSVRIIAKDPLKLAEQFSKELGFKTWFLGDLPSGEKVVMVLLPSGQSIEIVSQHPSYSRVLVNVAKSLTLGIEVDEIHETQKFLKNSGIALFPTIPVHVAGSEDKPKMFELLFLATQLYPYSSMHYVKKFYDNIEEVRNTYPNLDDRPWRNHKNGVVAIQEVWMVTSSIDREKSHLAPVGLLDTVTREKGILVYRLGDTLLKMVSPEYKPLSETIAKRLNEYGPGIFRINFKVERKKGSKDLLTDTYDRDTPFSLAGMDTEFVFSTSKDNLGIFSE